MIQELFKKILNPSDWDLVGFGGLVLSLAISNSASFKIVQSSDNFLRLGESSS